MQFFHKIIFTLQIAFLPNKFHFYFTNCDFSTNFLFYLTNFSCLLHIFAFFYRKFHFYFTNFIFYFTYYNFALKISFLFYKFHFCSTNCNFYFTIFLFTSQNSILTPKKFSFLPHKTHTYFTLCCSIGRSYINLLGVSLFFGAQAHYSVFGECATWSRR